MGAAPVMLLLPWPSPRLQQHSAHMFRRHTVYDAAGFQQSQLAAIAPGDRLPTGMSPSIVTRDGKPILAIATVGSSLFPETARQPEPLTLETA